MSNYNKNETSHVITRWTDKRRQKEPLFEIFSSLPVKCRINYQHVFDVWIQINDELDRLDVDLTVTDLEYQYAQSQHDYAAIMSCHNDMTRLYEEQALARVDREVIEQHPVIQTIIQIQNKKFKF